MRYTFIIHLELLLVFLTASALAKPFPAGLQVKDVQNSLKQIFPNGLPNKLSVRGIIQIPKIPAIPGRPAPPPSVERFRLGNQDYDLAGALKILNTGNTVSNDANDGIKFGNKFGMNDAPELIGKGLSPVPATAGSVLHEFRIDASGGGTNRILLDIKNHKLYFTADHYVHTVPYSTVFEEFFPLKQYAESRKGEFRREIQAGPTQMKEYQRNIFNELTEAENKFVTQIRNKMTPEELRTWKSNPTYDDVRDAFMRHWENRVKPMNAAEFAKHVDELGLPKAKVTFATHDGFVIQGPSGNSYFHFFDKSGGPAGERFLLQRAADKKVKILSFEKGPKKGVKLMIKEFKSTQGVLPAADPCLRRLARRQSNGCFRFSPKVDDPKSIKFELSTSQEKLALQELEKSAAGRAFNAAVKSWKLAKPFIEEAGNVAGGALIATMVSFDAYRIVDACKTSENRDVRECMTNVVIMALDIASTVGCGLVGGPAASIVCGMAASVLTAPFAAGMVDIGAGVSQAFRDLYNFWRQGQMDQGFKAALGNIQNARNQVIARFEPLANHILEGVKRSTRFLGQTINNIGNRLRGFFGGEGFEGESSTFELSLLGLFRNRLYSDGYRFISVVAHCRSSFGTSTKQSQRIDLNQFVRPLNVTTERCPFVQNIVTIDIMLHRNTASAIKCQDVSVPSGNLRFREPPSMLQNLQWRPVAHLSRYIVSSCTGMGPIQEE
ncbi:hypothetical protein BKA69DRAFT_1045752 [Paraphysoderma sedebokerense]|nr:hypothetical protein BKA69DRAFT_1045752 [Paraphysoderma sedebokerense]